MAVAGVAMSVVLTGCGGSPKGVAEDFVDAIIQRETDKAVKYCNMNNATANQIKERNEALDNLGKEINDDKLEAEAINEEIEVPAENSGYRIVNGAKITGESAEVLVQFKKGKDKKPDGIEVKLLKVDGSWTVMDYRTRSGLDTSDR